MPKVGKKNGVPVTPIEAWVHTHKGSDPNSLNGMEATIFLDKYKKKSIELNGEGFDWLHSPVDPLALYECSDGRPHGKWATFNGIVDDREAMIEVKSSHISLAASKRKRREEHECETRRLSHNARLSNEYVESLVVWSNNAHNHNTNVQKFMESVAAHIGMSSCAIPSLPTPPPPPPRYESPLPSNLSLQNSKVLMNMLADFLVQLYLHCPLHMMKFQPPRHMKIM